MALYGSAGNEIDNTTYTPEKIPELQVRSLFASLRVPEKWRKALALKEFLLVENICTLGSTEDSFVTRVKKIFLTDLDADAGVQEIEMSKLMALWQACRDIRQQRTDQRSRLAEDPKKVPEIPQVERAVLRMKTRERNKEILWNEFTTPHDKFEDLVRRDVIVNGMLPFYEIYQIRLKCDKIQSTSMLTRDIKKLLQVTEQEDFAQITTEESALNGSRRYTWSSTRWGSRRTMKLRVHAGTFTRSRTSVLATQVWLICSRRTLCQPMQILRPNKKLIEHSFFSFFAFHSNPVLPKFILHFRRITEAPMLRPSARIIYQLVSTWCRLPR